jgi:hypothetical protein
LDFLPFDLDLPPDIVLPKLEVVLGVAVSTSPPIIKGEDELDVEVGLELGLEVLDVVSSSAVMEPPRFHSLLRALARFIASG